MKNMLIKIVDKNKEKIDKVLSAVNGRARRRILDYERLLDVVKTAQEQIKRTVGDSKSSVYGAKVHYAPNAVFARSYKYEAEGTCVIFHFNQNGEAVLTYAYRNRISKDTSKQYDVEFTEKQKALMLKYASRF
jgi:hypothetical protein